VRSIGHLSDENSARLFGDFLLAQGVGNQVERQGDREWTIWISEEDNVDRAAKLLAEFRENPADLKYRTAAESAAEVRASKAKEEAAYRKKLRRGRQLFRPMTSYAFGPLTFVLIVISVAVFIFSKFGTDPERVLALFISATDGDRTLPEIRHGEIWRLFTPMFIHFNVLHILFNMLWLRDLGSMIEGRQNSFQLAILSLVIAAGSNLAQYYAKGPVFGGMSGVVYGLLGYVWIRGKRDPGSGLYLHPSTVTMMIIWFLACATGILGPIANYAHGAGLLIGMAWGFLSSWRYR